MRIIPLLVTIIALGTPTPVFALTEFEYLQAAKEFADAYLAPRNIEIADSINSTLFAEDVKGTIDATTNFDGRELSTEYLFGLLRTIALDPMEPSVFGTPLSYTISHILVQRNTVAAGIKYEFYYPVLDRTWPIEIEFFFNFNEQRQITEYDAIFRRWAWAIEDIKPFLIPHMARAVGISPNNETEVLQQYLGGKVCEAAEAHCTGEDEQYTSREQCMSFLLDKPLGEFYRAGEDNLLCRYLHTNMLALRPSVHCSHIGPSGGDMCIPRNYTEVVHDNHLPQGFLAVEENTPENEGERTYDNPGSSEPLDPLLEISLSKADSHSWDPTLFATCTFGYFLVLWASSKIIFALMNKYNGVFQLLRHDLQKNVVMYIMNIIFTTIALSLQLSAMPIMAGTYRLWIIRVIRTGAAMICGLYAFELIYRFDMRWPLMVHHVLTIVAISAAFTVMEITASMSFVISSTLWAFQATVEQSMFVGLLGYRLKWPRRTVAKILKFSATQALTIKVASSIALIVYWGIKQSAFTRPVARGWAATVWILNLGLMATQIWGSWVTWKIGARVAGDDTWPEDTRRGATAHLRSPFSYRKIFSLGRHRRTKTMAPIMSDAERSIGDYKLETVNPSPASSSLGYTTEQLVQPLEPVLPHDPVGSRLSGLGWSATSLEARGGQHRQI